jgi:hypothetical protein
MGPFWTDTGYVREFDSIAAPRTLPPKQITCQKIAFLAKRGRID